MGRGTFGPITVRKFNAGRYPAKQGSDDQHPRRGAACQQPPAGAIGLFEVQGASQTDRPPLQPGPQLCFVVSSRWGGPNGTKPGSPARRGWWTKAGSA